MFRRSFIPPRSAIVFALAMLILILQACATPPEIKTVSKSQLELIDALDSAVSDLQSAVARFHREQADLIRIEGRMLIAQQAIDEATQLDKEITADQFFKHFETNVRPWYTTDFGESTVQSRLDELNKQIESESDEVRKATLVTRRNMLEFDLAEPLNKPAGVKSIENTIREGIGREQDTARNVTESLRLLRAQIALMKAMQTNVDTWLSIDVTLSDKQARELNEAFVEARAALKKDSGT